jgi:hypothetical protein
MDFSALSWLYPLEGLVTTFIGFDLHRAQIAYDALDTDSGEVKTGRIWRRPPYRRPVTRSLPEPR